MASWEEPKRDWVDGDTLNLSDWNRITGNLAELYDKFSEMYTLSWEYSPSQLTCNDDFYFDEVLTLNNALYALCVDTNNSCEWINWEKYDVSYHPQIYTAEELNAIENKEFELAEEIKNQKEGRRKLQFNFGIQGGF